MGSAEGKGLDLTTASTKRFVEDMTADQKQQFYKDVLGDVMPIGINNLGNTCYLNSTLQVFRRIKALKHLILTTGRHSDPLTNEMRELFLDLDNSGDTVSPWQFVEVFMGKFPEFAQPAEGGQGYQQQDADECFMGLLQKLDHDLSAGGASKSDDLFGFKIDYEFKNTEDETEEPTYMSEAFKKLGCVIDNQANPVNLMTDGIQAGLVADVEKMSQNQGRNCVYSKTGKIGSLPKYLIVQKLRFIWKPANAATQTQAGKAKIMRNVMFPKVLELEPFCTDAIKSTITHGKELQRKI
jgi:ubiquitin carboxyl-terminal hydrolase 14